MSSCSEDAWLCVHTRSRTNGLEFEIADTERDQIRRDGLGHAKRVIAVADRIDLISRAHDRKEFWRRSDARLVRQSDSWRVLQRDPAARMDRLRLGIQKRMFPASRLRRLEPLQAARVGRRLVLHAHHESR